MINSMEEAIMEGAKRKMEEFAQTYFNDYRTLQTAVLPGDAAEEIMAYASSRQIDLIIMGTHGRKGLEKVLFGSVAERVVKNAPVPVLVVNPYKTRASD